MFALYVIACAEQKWYIGKAPVMTSVCDYFSENGPGGNEWTIRYKPIRAIHTVYCFVDKDEDVYTERYMKMYGIDHVRGGQYQRITLPWYQRKQIVDQIGTGSIMENIVEECEDLYKDWLIIDTTLRSDHSPSMTSDVSHDTDIDDTILGLSIRSTPPYCIRCRKHTHFIDQCYSLRMSAIFSDSARITPRKRKL